jgi:hypothetical protein
MRILGIVAICAALCGCATITEGTTQNILVEMVPTTGTCVLTRKGEALGASTPDNRIVTVSKSMNDINFDCSAPGYQPKQELLTSATSTATVVSFFTLDFGIVDAATGAWKKYPERLTVVLQPLPKPIPVPALTDGKHTTKLPSMSEVVNSPAASR